MSKFADHSVILHGTVETSCQYKAILRGFGVGCAPMNSGYAEIVANAPRKPSKQNKADGERGERAGSETDFLLWDLLARKPGGFTGFSSKNFKDKDCFKERGRVQSLPLQKLLLWISGLWGVATEMHFLANIPWNHASSCHAQKEAATALDQFYGDLKKETPTCLFYSVSVAAECWLMLLFPQEAKHGDSCGEPKTLTLPVVFPRQLWLQPRTMGQCIYWGWERQMHYFSRSCCRLMQNMHATSAFVAEQDMLAQPCRFIRTCPNRCKFTHHNVFPCCSLWLCQGREGWNS